MTASQSTQRVRWYDALFGVLVMASTFGCLWWLLISLYLGWPWWISSLAAVFLIVCALAWCAGVKGDT